MNKKEILILIVIVVAVVLIIIFGSSGSGVPNDEVLPGEGAGEEVSSTFDPTVPDKNLELTEPKTETEAAPGVETKLRVFEMTATRSGYDPEEIVVNQGDTISIRVKTAGTGYDISIPDMGLYQVVEEGGEKRLEFQALTPGTFTYLCRDVCPGGNEIKGSLIIKSR